MCTHHYDHDHDLAGCGHDHSADQPDRRKMLQGLAAGGAMVTAGPALAGCSTNPETGRKQLVGLVSEAQLSSMATASWADTKQKMPTTTDPRYTTRLRNIGSRIARGANKTGESWDYAVFEKDSKNAFVLPGNRVGFFKGMMDFADNDDQIAAVMGHEVGHVTGRHARERFSQQMFTQLVQVGGVILAGSQIAKQCKDRTKVRTQREYYECQRKAQRQTQLIQAGLGMGLAVGVTLPFSRKHESESDLLGAKYMYKAGYDPYQSVKLWEKMGEERASRTPQFLSTHPDPSKRARDLYNYIKYQEKLGSQGWESIEVPKNT